MHATTKDTLTTVGEHHYYLSGKKGLYLAHPLLAKAIKGENTTDSYYADKLAYLRSHGVVDGQDPNADIELVGYTSDLVLNQLANTSQVVFEVTDACNLSCVYCGYGEMYQGYDKRENKQLPIEKAKQLIDYLVNLWESDRNTSSNHQVFFTFYGGEPLLNMPFIETIVNYVEQLKCSTRTFRFSMTTNAMLLKRYMDYLVAHNFSLLLSLDGNEENTGYRIDHAGQPAYQRIVENVDALREAYPDYFEENVNFSTVLHNKNSMESIYRYFKDKYNKIPTIGELNPGGVKDDMREQFMKTYQNSYESLRKSEHYSEIEKSMFVSTGSYKGSSIFLHKHSGFVYPSYSQLVYEQENKRRLPTGTCLPFSRKVFITVNGKLIPCEHISQQFALGEVTDNGEVKLDFQAIADRYNAYFAKLEKQCKHCQNLSDCTQCIFNLPIEKDNVACHGYMNKDEFRRYLSSQVGFLTKHRDDYYRIMNEVTIS